MAPRRLTGSRLAVITATSISLVVLIPVLIVGLVAVYHHRANANDAAAEQRDLVDAVSAIPGVSVDETTADHGVRAGGGSSDCEAWAEVTVMTTLSPERLFELLNDRGGPLYEMPEPVAGNRLLVRSGSPLGTHFFDWSCR